MSLGGGGLQEPSQASAWIKVRSKLAGGILVGSGMGHIISLYLCTGTYYRTIPIPIASYCMGAYYSSTYDRVPWHSYYPHHIQIGPLQLCKLSSFKRLIRRTAFRNPGRVLRSSECLPPWYVVPGIRLMSRPAAFSPTSVASNMMCPAPHHNSATLMGGRCSSHGSSSRLAAVNPNTAK